MPPSGFTTVCVNGWNNTLILWVKSSGEPRLHYVLQTRIAIRVFANFFSVESMCGFPALRASSCFKWQLFEFHVDPVCLNYLGLSIYYYAEQRKGLQREGETWPAGCVFAIHKWKHDEWIDLKSSLAWLACKYITWPTKSSRTGGTCSQHLCCVENVHFHKLSPAKRTSENGILSHLHSSAMGAFEGRRLHLFWKLLNFQDFQMQIIQAGRHRKHKFGLRDTGSVAKFSRCRYRSEF